MLFRNVYIIRGWGDSPAGGVLALHAANLALPKVSPGVIPEDKVRSML